MSKARLEAFSDGVIAVAITLLALDIRVPAVGGPSSLGHELARQWPIYVAYVTSFATIGIIWINHHAMINRLRQPDQAIMILNVLLLMAIGVLPFTTSLMADYLRESHGQHLAAAIYSGSFLVMSLLFIALNRHILYPKAHLLAYQMSESRRRQVLVRGAAGIIPYVLATAFAALSAYVSLAICIAVAVFYALPIASGGPDEPPPLGPGA